MKNKWKSIERLSTLRSGYSCFEDDERPFYEALSEGIDAIKKSMWIPVTEELPKVGELVLCSYAGCISIGCISDSKRWYDDNNNQIWGIDAWKHLPQPYEKEENDYIDHSCSRCKHNDETNGEHCYECVKGIGDHF